MPTPKPPYPVEFRQQMVELVHAGRAPAQLAREFDPGAYDVSRAQGLGERLRRVARRR